MIRPLLCVAALALAVTSVSRVIAAGPRYAVTQLRPIAIAAGTYANVHDINDNGLSVGDETRLNSTSPFTPVSSATRGLAWANGTDAATALPTPAGRVGTTAFRVNNAGTIVGKAYLSSGAAATAILSGSVPTIINSTTTFTVDGINAGGEVVGYDSNGPFVIRNGVYSSIRKGAYSNIEVNGINDAGTIVGQPFGFSSSGERALRLSTTADPVAIVNVEAGATAINNVGTVAGYVRVSSGGVLLRQAATFKNGTTTLLGNVPRAGDGRALAGLVADLNDRGDAIGTSGPGTGSQAEQAPFLFRDGKLLDLTSLLEGTLPAGFRPAAINNRGQIVGTAYVDHDNNTSTPRIGQSYRLDPIRLAGDANADGVVDVADLGILATSFGGTGPAFYETGDFNYDWRVDVADLGILATAYGTPKTWAADLSRFNLPAVPEPATLATLSLAALMFYRRRRA